MGGGGGADAADVKGAAYVQAEAARQAAQEELWGNRADQRGPIGSSTWENSMVDSKTGRPIIQGPDGRWYFTDVVGAPDLGGGIGAVGPGGTGNPTSADILADWIHRNDPSEARNIDPVNSWAQTTTLTPEMQKILEERQGLISDKTGYQAGVVADWGANPNDFNDIGGGNLAGTITKGELGAYGMNAPNMGAQDWRQFGTTGQTIGANQWQNQGNSNPTIGANQWQNQGNSNPTIGADQWQNLGNSDPTIGADDWRQFGSTGQTIGAGDFDARFGGQEQSGGFGDHGMGNSSWDQINYTPEAIRNQAEQQTMDYMNSQLDPQWETKKNDLEVQLANKGLQAGDAQYDNAMASMSKNRNSAYEGARNQALADSRAEANMLWGQEMSRSEQKNSQTQADLDNIYRARQSNIQNYQQQRGQDMQGYLDYQNSAFDQDYKGRQQQIDANLNYGNSAFGQDFQSRQQSLDAQLNYGNSAFRQDFDSRQQSLDAQLGYGREAFNQDFQSRQQSLDAQLGYGREAFGQDYQSRQQQLDANRLYSNDAFNQDLQARQANITNALNFGREEFGQSQQQQQLALQARIAQEQLNQGRFGAMDPNQDITTITDALG